MFTFYEKSEDEKPGATEGTSKGSTLLIVFHIRIFIKKRFNFRTLNFVYS